MKKKALLVTFCLLTLCGCGKVPTLQNGEEAIVTFKKDGKESGISAEELFNTLKETYGLTAAVELIDKYVYETEFKDYLDEANKSTDSYVKALKENYSSDEELLTALKNYGYSSLDQYKNQVYMSYLRNHGLEEYAKLQITDKQIQDYYDKDQKEDVEVYQILITPEVTDNMTTEEKEAKEKEAKETVKSIIKKLDKADDKLETFKKLVKEYSKDAATNTNDGNMGYINYSSLDSNYDELLDAVYKLKDGEYSTEVITTELGYHVIYRNASKEKDTLENMKELIVSTLARELMNSDSTLYVNSLKYYRNLYNMKIQDSELDRQYGIYLNNLLNSNNNSSN